MNDPPNDRPLPPPHDPRLEARRTTERSPDNPMAWIVRAETELDAGDAAAGLACAQRALSLAPGHPDALARVGRAQWLQGRYGDAAASLRAALRSAPQHAGIALWLGHALQDAGEAEAANGAYAHAHRLAPSESRIAASLLACRRRLCDWHDLDALSRQVRDAVRRGEAVIEPAAFLGEDATAADQLQCARLRALAVASTVRPLPPPAAAEPASRLRLGFLSDGFGAHPTGRLTVAFFEALAARSEIELHLFAGGGDADSDIRRRLRASVHALHDVAQRPHADIAWTIRNAGIEVLVDLRGWGAGAPEVLAMRPAPVQLNWLAYPGTSGAPWIDAVLADGFVLPPSLAPHFSEGVLRLPRCFQPSDTARALPPPATRADCGLPEHGVVFCCFNSSDKLNPASFQRAMRVLADVPGSVLWLLSGPGDADRRLREAAQTAGIAAGRLVFMARQAHVDYLARLQCADLFLDTSPYNAHANASDALWAGCPVLTRPGDTFAARVAGSLNHHLGLDDMNAEDDVRYVATAIALGRDAERLHALRQRLQAARAASGVFDMPSFARDFADAVCAFAR